MMRPAQRLTQIERDVRESQDRYYVWRQDMDTGLFTCPDFPTLTCSRDDANTKTNGLGINIFVVYEN